MYGVSCQVLELWSIGYSGRRAFVNHIYKMICKFKKFQLNLREEVRSFESSLGQIDLQQIIGDGLFLIFTSLDIFPLGRARRGRFGDLGPAGVRGGAARRGGWEGAAAAEAGARGSP